VSILERLPDMQASASWIRLAALAVRDEIRGALDRRSNNRRSPRNDLPGFAASVSSGAPPDFHLLFGRPGLSSIGGGHGAPPE
jgi:hypothetical protein